MGTKRRRTKVMLAFFGSCPGSWGEWDRVIASTAIKKEDLHINTAEFLAALITCETFSHFCSGYITTLKLDNLVAKAWLDSSRCTKFPFDRCAQGAHLFRLKNTMKIRTRWLSSKQNTLADICSRKPFSKRKSGHLIA